MTSTPGSEPTYGGAPERDAATPAGRPSGGANAAPGRDTRTHHGWVNSGDGWLVAALGQGAWLANYAQQPLLWIVPGLGVLMPWLAYASWHGYRETLDAGAWPALD